jgi:hypothetical protein
MNRSLINHDLDNLVYEKRVRKNINDPQVLIIPPIKAISKPKKAYIK